MRIQRASRSFSPRRPRSKDLGSQEISLTSCDEQREKNHVTRWCRVRTSWTTRIMLGQIYQTCKLRRDHHFVRHFNGAGQFSIHATWGLSCWNSSAVTRRANSYQRSKTLFVSSYSGSACTSQKDKMALRKATYLYLSTKLLKKVVKLIVQRLTKSV